MERVPKGRETREERLFFPVGRDRLARRRPAELDHPVSPVPGIEPAGLESSVPRRAVYQPRATQPGSLSQLRFAEPVCLQIAPRSACVLTRNSPGYTGGVCPPGRRLRGGQCASHTEARPRALGTFWLRLRLCLIWVALWGVRVGSKVRKRWRGCV